MSKSEKRLSLEEIQKRLNEVREIALKSREQIKGITEKSSVQVKELAEKSKDQFKKTVEERPLESSATIFFFGLIVGLALSAAFSRRD